MPKNLLLPAPDLFGKADTCLSSLTFTGPILPETAIMNHEHKMEIRVRYSDTDAMGFLHHGNYASYFEMGRTELSRQEGNSYREMEEAGIFFVVTKLTCRYRLPARYDDLLTLTTRITNIGMAKLVHEYQIHRGSELITTAESVLACVDKEGKVRRLSEVL